MRVLIDHNDEWNDNRLRFDYTPETPKEYVLVEITTEDGSIIASTEANINDLITMLEILRPPKLQEEPAKKPKWNPI